MHEVCGLLAAIAVNLQKEEASCHEKVATEWEMLGVLEVKFGYSCDIYDVFSAWGAKE